MTSQSDYYSHLNVSVLAKLKRLKIQENILYSSISKSFLTLGQERQNFTEIEAIDGIKRYESSLCDLFTEVKNMFEDIKINTNPHNMNELDIDEVKRDIFRLESKLRTLKNHLETELRSLILGAKDILNELSTNSAVHTTVNHKLSKASAKTFTDIVPSPVKVLINCPFKCPEVQNLQEFLKNSRNRYNGWNEYNHNVFVQIWNKYFSTENAEDLLKQDGCEENTERFHQFRDEVMEKIPGLTLEDIKSNYTWYTEFVFLKTQQQKALEKWKQNKQKIMKKGEKEKQKPQSCLSNSSANYSTSKLLFNTSKDTLQPDGNPPMNSHNLRRSYKKPVANFSKTKNNEVNDALHMSGILKQTEQLRESKDQWKPSSLLSMPEGKRQLRIPSWRLGLHY